MKKSRPEGLIFKDEHVFSGDAVKASNTDVFCWQDHRWKRLKLLKASCMFFCCCVQVCMALAGIQGGLRRRTVVPSCSRKLIYRQRKRGSISVLDPLHMQSCHRHAEAAAISACPCTCQPSWVLFNFPPRSLSVSPSFTAPSYILLLRANNYSPCLGTPA